MSPVFRHGRLRLYLLKLLDEEPRHGYEVIRLLQDRFLGVYAPSPGTIYPRLARLEEEGLVTHDEADGRKVYRITAAGREELRARHDDLVELEEEITASVRDIAREVSEDVRATVRSLREDLTSAARDMHGPRQRKRGDVWREGTAGHGAGWREAQAAREQAQRDASAERARAQQEARTGRERAQEEAGAERDRARAHRDRDPHAFEDMERLARQFTREFQRAAEQAQIVGEAAVTSLRDILGDALQRIHTEVFRPGGTKDDPHGPGTPPGSPTEAQDDHPGGHDATT